MFAADLRTEAARGGKRNDEIAGAGEAHLAGGQAHGVFGHLGVVVILGVVVLIDAAESVKKIDDRRRLFGALLGG